MEFEEQLEHILELIEEKKYASIRAEIAEWNEADIAELLDELPGAEATKIFRLLPKDMAADVFSFLPIETEQQMISTLTDRETRNIIENLYADDAADLLEEMPANVVKKILANASAETRNDINHLLQYKEDSAGSLMTIEYTALKEEWTVAQAMEEIRRTGMENETINICYVLTDSRELVGIVSLRDLILSDPDAALKDVMEDRPITVKTSDDQEEVAQDFQKYDFTAMPVVDSENRMVGIITVDDIVDIMEEEATEDMEKMAAIVPTDKPYMKLGVFELVKKRIPWLLLLMISATFTGMIITSFEEKLARYVVLTAYIPMLMDTGGNSGSQASVMIIRGLSLNEIEFKDTLRVIWKEMRVAVCCGAILAVANFVKLMLFDRLTVVVAATICCTLVVTVFCAKLVGCTLPILAKKLGFDPAVMASPFITTIVDAISLLVYFRFATVFLGL
ncbi:MAG: magnesium transporter [Lachnospiraceae bacterium]|nr:magnesium transporter [Lachnospiraceae bacterium]